MMKRTVTLILFFLLFFTQSSFASPVQAPDIKLPGIDGVVHLKEYKGKVVYLDFWASWCMPCRKSFPWMRDIKQRYAGQGFEVIAVNLDKERRLADEFLKTMDVNFVIAFDESGESAASYKLKGMPSSYLISRDGKIHASHKGFRGKDEQRLESAIQLLLNDLPVTENN